MHLIAKASVALIALTAVAYAGDDPFADIYSNTLVYTSAKNIVMKVLANKDGTWSATSTDPKNPKSGGEWARLGGWVCVTDAAMTKEKPNCSEVVAHKVGDKWTVPAADKTMTQVTLVSGR